MFHLYLALCLTQAPKMERDPEKLPIPFERFTTPDALGRTVTAYLSKAPAGAAGKRLPVVLFVGGSGSQSVWSMHEGKINAGLQGLLNMQAKKRARVLVVEKIGVKYLDEPRRPGTATEGSPEFLREHTLPRWAAANVAALTAVLALPEIDPTRVLVVGHSEGGVVAACVAAECKRVTHVAPLSTSGNSQLQSLLALARRRAPPEHADDAVRQTLEGWAKVRAKPESVEDFWMGHPHRRWSSFLSHSTIEELKRSKAKIYLAHGTEDQAEAVESFDAMHAEMLAHGRDVTAERIQGGDHGLSVGPNGGGPTKVFGNVVEWFLK